ncbi:uncharacterized protein LOC135161489 [Diachasmimorpha longicaudata]|uniref:uncharacterized protein LOC135161489 n=1 Tax=Diachasmimorpha longicaudata TaxID=58733 RepID=UPI0030B86F90
MKRGIQGESAELFEKSITTSTRKQYESGLRAWWNFSYENNLDVYDTKTPQIIDFLHKMFKKGASYSSLNTTRSAISLISINNINNDGMISGFFKSVFKERPTKPKYTTTWDVSPVLDFLEKLAPFKQLKLKEAGEKLSTLLALTSAQRLQTLALINIDNIVIDSTGLSIKITERIKTSKADAYQPELILPFFQEKSNLCVASLILEYLDITKELRDKNAKYLLITSTKPHTSAKAETIGHWIKNTLNKAGIDTNKFTAYSTRLAAVSDAHKKGVDVNMIMKTAGWSQGSQTIFKFYNRPIEAQSGTFARTIFG